MLTKEEDNLVKIYEKSMQDNWALSAVTDYGTTRSLTYGQLAYQIACIHLLMKNLKIEKGDKISLMGRNNCNWVSVYLATITYGAVIVPILQDFKPNDALHIINHSESKMLFITDAIWEGFEMSMLENVLAVYSLQDFKVIADRRDLINEIENGQIISWEQAQAQMQETYPNGYSQCDVHYDDRSNAELASINYTSGTTGFSKGVMTPANALAGNIKFSRLTHQVFRGCRHVVFLPLAHAYGCAIDFLSVLAVGGHSYFIGRTPSPKILVQAFKEIRPTLILTVPLILEKIYKKQVAPQIAKAPLSWVLKMPLLDDIVLAKIREELMEVFGGCFSQMIVGGAPLNADVEAFLHRIKFPITIGYGMTETAPLISYTFWEQYKPFSCGQVLDGLMEIRVDSPNQEGIGELQVRGEHLMLGYYKNEEATKQVFTKDNWLKTGDLGTIDEDGFIYIKGRNKTMLLGPSGQNIYPEEIESKLNNMPFVMESIVLQHEDGRLIALAYPDYEAVDANHLDEAKLQEAIEENRKQLNLQLAVYEQISQIKLYPHEFEKTPKKSIKRFLYTQMI